MKNFRKIFISCCLVCVIGIWSCATAQNRSVHLQSNLMKGLQVWGITQSANSVYNLVQDPKGNYFHSMNLGWSSIDLMLGSVGNYQAKRISSDNSIGYSKKLSKIFLVNSILDIGYVATGVAMMNNWDKRISEFGDAILVQGGFLFAFDLTAFLLHRRLYKKNRYSTPK